MSDFSGPIVPVPPRFIQDVQESSTGASTAASPTFATPLQQVPQPVGTSSNYLPLWRRISKRRIIGLCLLTVSLAAGVLIAFYGFNINKNLQSATQGNTSSLVKTQTVELAGLSQRLNNGSTTAGTLTVNGSVDVADSLVLQPSGQPTGAVAGQMYYDRAQNQLGYYNGSAFIYLQGASGSTNIVNNFVSNGVTLAGTGGTLAVITSSGSLGDSLLRQSGNTVAVSGNLNVQGAYQINGAQISSANLANDADLAKLGTNQTFSGANTFKNSADSAASFQVQNASGANLFTIDTANAALVLGQDGGTPTATAIRGGAAIGTNISGANLSINAANGTGTGGSGNIIFNTAAGLNNPQVSLDAAIGNEGDTSSDLTWTHTTGVQHDRVMIVPVDTSQIANPAVATSVSYNGVPLTRLANLVAGESAGSVWYMVNPPSGPHQVVVKFSGQTSGVGAESITFYNVDQANAIGGFATNQQTGAGVVTTLTGTNAGQGVFDAVMARADWGFPSPGPGQSQIYLLASNSRTAGSFKQADAGSTTASWNSLGGTSDLNHVVIALNPEPNLTPDILTERLRVTQSGVGIALGSSENTTYDLTLGGSANRTVAVNQNPTSGAGRSLTLMAGAGAVNGNNNGGDLVLQGGQATGAGSGGGVIVKPKTDSTTAFRVQDAAALNTVLSVDTTNKIVTVAALQVNAALTVNGHIITGGAAPNIAAGVAACTAPTLAVSGTDTSGTITVTTGSGCGANGILATLSFAAAFGAAPHVALTPGNAASQTLGAYVDNGTASATLFKIGTSNTPSDTTTYQWNYLTVQ